MPEHCPVYRKIGGHNYPWVYSGPIGAIITPQYQGVMHDPWLPFASSLCGACGEVCPVKIDIPKMLLELRDETYRSQGAQGRAGWRSWDSALWAWLMRHPGLFEMAGMVGSVIASGDSGWMTRLPGLMTVGPGKAWISQRDLPAPAPQSFRQLWRERRSRS